MKFTQHLLFSLLIITTLSFNSHGLSYVECQKKPGPIQVNHEAFDAYLVFEYSNDTPSAYGTISWGTYPTLSYGPTLKVMQNELLKALLNNKKILYNLDIVNIDENNQIKTNLMRLSIHSVGFRSCTTSLVPDNFSDSQTSVFEITSNGQKWLTLPISK